MEVQRNENSQNEVISANDISHQCDDLDPNVSNNGGMEARCEASEEEVRGILEVIASTGKFWHEWDKLKLMLSFQLKQVLSEYPEARMSNEQQSSLLGETYPDLVKRLNEALLSFIEGPPFTLQRLCEILLDPRSIYQSLSKLSLALEKNLLVASTLSICIDPYPSTMPQNQNEPDKEKEDLLPPPVEPNVMSICTDAYPPAMLQNQDESEKDKEELLLPPVQPNIIENGVGDGDEIMAEVETTEIDDDVTIDMETFEGIVGSPDTNPMPTSNS